VENPRSAFISMFLLKKSMVFILVSFESQTVFLSEGSTYPEHFGSAVTTLVLKLNNEQKKPMYLRGAAYSVSKR
jgi:hypothetical protein